MSSVNSEEFVENHHLSTPVAEGGKYVEIDDVRITPGRIHFENAYEGKRYEMKVVIQNCGKYRAFIRLLEPSSKVFELESFVRGKYLCPGMKIIRTVKYTYSRTLDIQRGFATFFINDKEVDYHFIVTLSEAVLSIEPQHIDFGRIDAVNHAAIRYFFIKNSGYKGTNFSIDLGRNPLEMIVEPIKGRVPAKTSVKISIEIVSSREGQFAEEFWIKTTPPQRVVLTGVFISPKLLIRKFVNSLNFALLDFKPTYYGCGSTQSLLIRNFSSSHSMFCVMAEIKGTTMTLEEARKIDDNYRNFAVKPVDGRMAALRGAAIQMTFAPVRTEKVDKTYAACFIKVIRLDCRDVSSEDVICESLKQLPQLDSRKNSLSRFSTSKETFIISGSSERIAFDFEEGSADESFSFEHAIMVCLHGEKEKAAIGLRPSVINLTELTLDKNYQRELVITNKSGRLPVIVKYNKVPTVDVIPQQFELEPGGRKEVMITIRTYKLDRIVKYITFNLLNKNNMVEKNLLKKVGNAYLKVISATTEVVRKPRSDQCVMCQEVPQLASDFPYRLTESEALKKIENDNFYLDYIRGLQKVPILENETDYPVTYSKLLLREDLKCQDHDSRRSQIRRFTPYIPLAPRLLYNIKLTPKSIKLQKVAAFTTISDFFEIENLNSFPIRIAVKATKPCISFEIQSRYVIDKNEKKKIFFTFSTSRVGRYFVNINILVNDATLYEITAVAQVVPKTVNLETATLTFGEDDGHFKFFKVINPLNAYTCFEWEVPGDFFDIIPKEGGIKAERDILCMVTHSPDPSQPNVSECTLTSESGQKKILTISANKKPHLVVFDSYDVDFGIIPINMSIRRKVILKNLRSSRVTFSVPSGVPIPGITLEPMEGTLDGFDSQVFVIDALIKVVIEFSSFIVFTINETENIDVRIQGVVEFPNISFQPDDVHFRKIAPFSYDVLALKVKNLSRCEVSITFPPEEVSEITITDSEDEIYDHRGKVVLQPDKSVLLFLHFHPTYILTQTIFLPYVINDIFGPVRINSTASVNPNHFIEDYIFDYIKIDDVRLLKVPSTLPRVRINCNAFNKILEFSTLSVSLVYFGEDHYSNVSSTDFEITNTSTESADLCIRLDELQHPFSLSPKGDMNIEYYEVSYKVLLKPNDKATFEVGFFPSELGNYAIKLPIFLKNYYNNRIFNFLTIKGTYDTPTIIPSVERCDFEPVPVNISNEVRVSLRMKNHFERCQISFACDLPGLYSTFDNGNSPGKGDSVLEVTMSYSEVRPKCFDTAASFTCSCGAKCTIAITGVVDSCLLTTHVFSHFLYHGEFDRSAVGIRPRFYTRLLNKNTTCFPLAPAGSDDLEYGVYMGNLRKTLENWIFSQVFYQRRYCKIPEGFSDFCKVSEPRRRLRFGGLGKPKFVEIPLVELIINIAGPKIRAHLGIGSLPDTDDPIAWLSYVSTVNSKVLRYLRSFAVFLPHVKSKYLLNYSQYVLYEKHKRPNDVPLSEETFYRLTQQCWIDLILQIIKTFFLFRTVAIPSDDPTPELPTCGLNRKSITQNSRLSIEEGDNSILEAGIYGEHEKELMAWLIDCYDDEKVTLWSDQELPEAKEIVYLDEDLRDGLILGAAIAHYCPYVKPEIREMYTRPFNPEELLHNSCVLVKVWQMLNFSHLISPLTIQNGGMVEMVLLAKYLYSVLPDCRPKEEIKIEAPLTQTNHATVELENLGLDSIHYSVIFFGKDSHLFGTTRSVVVQPRRTKTVKVFYHAKTLKNAVTHVLFSGETPGHKYGRSVCLKFVGVTDVSFACKRIPLEVDLYRPCEIVIEMESPFKVKAAYSMYFGYQPVSKEKNVLYSWDEIKNLKTVKELIFTDELCEFDETGKRSTKITLCCQEEGPRNMWIYYTNPEVGDWGVQFTVTGRVTDECYEQIDILLPENYANFACRCRRRIGVNANCPLMLHAKLPKKNNPLWNARKKIVLRDVSGEELGYWWRRIFTPVGTRILKLILDSETHPMRQELANRREYVVEMDPPAPLVTAKKVIIDDIISEDFVKLPIHPARHVNLVALKKSVVVRLKSTSTPIIRYFKFSFKTKTDEAHVTYVKDK